MAGPFRAEVEQSAEATVGVGKQVEVALTVRPRAAGYQVLHGASLIFGDVLGLFEVEAYFPNPIAIKIFPRLAAAPRLTIARTRLRIVRRR